ncbi:MAG: hypothetical protein ACRDG9_02365 [Actinomycetota bacterium]
MAGEHPDTWQRLIDLAGEPTAPGSGSAPSAEGDSGARMSLASLSQDGGGGASGGGGDGAQHGGGGGGGASDLRVDDHGMTRLVHRLRESDDRMGSAVRRLEKAGPKGLGTEELDEACAEFQSQWEHGIDKLGKATKSVTSALRDALELHLGNDERVRRMFGGH